MMKVDKRALGERAAHLPPLRRGKPSRSSGRTTEVTAAVDNEMKGARAS